MPSAQEGQVASYGRLNPWMRSWQLEASYAMWRERVSLRRQSSIPIHFEELATNDTSIVQLIANDAVEGIGMNMARVSQLHSSHIQSA